MRILVDINGVLKGRDDAPIGTGLIMVGTLSVYNDLTFMSDVSEAETSRWLDANKVVDYDRIIDSSIALVGEELAHRQMTFARGKGPIDLFITNNPSLWAYAFDMGIPSVMFGVPTYTRAEFRPDAPKGRRSWDEIEAVVKKQNELRTQDARLSRTEALNFEG
ncbi:hypothetical protein UFOVP46_78 [uncultured Caudovirales phage]|uniref:Uncharacterized protein n=1 Tax=uncultured Caudovirales phage TaxID=2100421 RepID=A0A6J5KS21_9CAUD|nr:hypothetical protein UFOVP46_78 [uncultured Caudovirales phage]